MLEKKVRFSVYDPNSHTHTCDSCLIFKSGTTGTQCGFILAIIGDSKQEYRLLINKMKIIQRDSLTCKNKRAINPFIFSGQPTDPPQFVLIPVEHIIAKLAYKKEANQFHFFQYPNTVQST
ncbi:unnamed protein product [Rotaria socialis]|uniref:Uncharacterized protein n=1 Tax=Rotaria socialis TaxID=392032 RepID=A0A819AEE9_9BILA|nr:unnamed protein product [Rotaria socialis]CAF4600304.1 unnamed protein product [Rotaria socialis]